MKSETVGRRTIEEISSNGLTHIHAQLFPSVGLSDNALAKRLGHKTAICLLGNFKNEFAHDRDYAIHSQRCKRQLGQDR